MWVPGRQTGNPCSCLPDPSATWPTNAAQASRAACAANGSEHKRQTGSACMFPAPIHCGREGDGHRGDPPTSALLPFRKDGQTDRSEEHTSELQSLMRISYAVFCLKKKKKLN